MASLVEGDAGFASRWVQNFVVRSRPWAQPGFMAVNHGRRLGLLGMVRLSQATFLTRLFSGQGAHCNCGTKSANQPLEAPHYLDGQAVHMKSLRHRLASKKCIL